MASEPGTTTEAPPRGTPVHVPRLLARLTGCDETEFVLRIVQPALVGMIDGTVSTLAPIFAAAVSSSSHTALVRYRFLRVSLSSSLIVVTLAGAIVLGIGVAIGSS